MAKGRTCGRAWFSSSRARELANQSGTCCGCNYNPPAMNATASAELARRVDRCDASASLVIAVDVMMRSQVSGVRWACDARPMTEAAVEHAHPIRKNKYVIHARTETFASVDEVQPSAPGAPALPQVWIGFGWVFGSTGMHLIERPVRGASEHEVRDEIFRRGRALIDALP